MSWIFTAAAVGAGATLVLTSRLGTISVAPAVGPRQSGILLTQAF